MGWLLKLVINMHVWLCMRLGVCVWLQPGAADTLCAHSHQQMPPDCARNNQLYMPNLMRSRQIRGGIRIPGPWRTALPFGLKEQFHWGRQPGPQLVPLLQSPPHHPSRALVPFLWALSGAAGLKRQEALPSLHLFLYLGWALPCMGRNSQRLSRKISLITRETRRMRRK